MQVSLPEEAYQLSADIYLSGIKGIKNPKCELSKVDLVNYVQNRADTAEEFLAIGKSAYKSEDARVEYEKLNPQTVLLYTSRPDEIAHPVNNNPNVRAKYLFAYIAQELSASLMRKKLGCYIHNLREFEKSFNPPLQQVSAEEFGKKRDQNVSEEEYYTFKLQSSRDLAKAILNKLN